MFGALTAEHGSLDSGTVRNGFIGVDALVENLAAEELGQHLLDLWNTGRAADEDDLVDLVFRDPGVLERLLDTEHALLEEVHAELLEQFALDDGVVVLTLGEHLALDWSRLSCG